MYDFYYVGKLELDKRHGNVIESLWEARVFWCTDEELVKKVKGNRVINLWMIDGKIVPRLYAVELGNKVYEAWKGLKIESLAGRDNFVQVETRKGYDMNHIVSALLGLPRIEEYLVLSKGQSCEYLYNLLESELIAQGYDLGGGFCV